LMMILIGVDIGWLINPLVLGYLSMLVYILLRVFERWEPRLRKGWRERGRRRVRLGRSGARTPLAIPTAERSRQGTFQSLTNLREGHLIRRWVNRPDVIRLSWPWTASRAALEVLSGCFMRSPRKVR
jgi:hypothetical protein